MSELSLQIIQPVHGTGFTGAAPVTLKGAVTGDPSGLFFKWFSSLNPLASATQPELNTNHSAAILNWSAPLAEFGTHVIVLAASDQDGNDLESVKKVARSAMTGGAPPAPAPCVVHRLVAEIRTPSANGQTLSKTSTTLEFPAPVRWAKEDPPGSNNWTDDKDYQKINGIGLSFRLAPAGAPDPAHSADISLDLASPHFIRANDKTWFQWIGALPANLGIGNYTLTLTVKGGGETATATRQVVLVP